jgi:hypothetical protein
MPNWINHRATLRPFTQNGSRIIERLLAAKNTHNWFGNAAPVEIQVLEKSLPVDVDIEVWFAANSKYPESPYKKDSESQAYSEAYQEYLKKQFAYVIDWSPLTFGVKWGACNESFSKVDDGVRYSCRTPYGVCEELYVYLTRNGIDVDVVCDGEMDGKYIFKSRGGQYTKHWTASGELCF